MEHQTRKPNISFRATSKQSGHRSGSWRLVRQSYNHRFSSYLELRSLDPKICSRASLETVLAPPRLLDARLANQDRLLWTVLDLTFQELGNHFSTSPEIKQWISLGLHRDGDKQRRRQRQRQRQRQGQTRRQRQRQEKRQKQRGTEAETNRRTENEAETGTETETEA